MDKSFLLTPVPIVPPIPQVRLMTDASGSGWGAVCQTPVSGRGMEVADKWPQAWTAFSMNWLELNAILLSPPSLSSPDPRSMHFPVVGQHHRTFVHPQAGFSGFSGFMGSVQGDFSFLPGSLDHPVPVTSQRDSERPCRQSLQGSLHFYGMGPGRTLVPVSVPEVGLPRHRHHGNLGEFQTLQIHLPFSRLSSYGLGYFLRAD